MSATQSPSSKSTGQVKWFNTKSGYGFITALDGEHVGKDIFVHYSSIRVTNNQYLYLVMGEYVEFSVVRPEKAAKEGTAAHEFHAVDISGIKGGMLMCEVRHAYSEDRPPRAKPSETRPASEGKRARPDDSAPRAEGEFQQVKKRVTRVNKKTAPSNA